MTKKEGNYTFKNAFLLKHAWSTKQVKSDRVSPWACAKELKTDQTLKTLQSRTEKPHALILQPKYADRAPLFCMCQPTFISLFSYCMFWVIIFACLLFKWRRGALTDADFKAKRRENKRRAALGLPPIKDMDELETEVSLPCFVLKSSARTGSCQKPSVSIQKIWNVCIIAENCTKHFQPFPQRESIDHLAL